MDLMDLKVEKLLVRKVVEMVEEKNEGWFSWNRRVSKVQSVKIRKWFS
jgi:hypothetical protein